MPNLFSGINLALQAMLSHQQSIHVTEHNVANANTPGYRRQVAVLSAGAPDPPAMLHRSTYVGQMGGGVVVERIRQYKLEFFDNRYRTELGASQQFAMKSQVLHQVEATLAETGDDGLVAKLDAFWNGWQNVSSDPTSLAYRSDLQQRGVDLAQSFNTRAEALLAIQKDQDLSISQRVEEINAIAVQITQINSQIPNVRAAGDEPNDLYDERDRLLDRLAELAGASSNVQPDGQVNVSIGGHALVVSNTAFELVAAPDPANSNLVSMTWAIDGQAASFNRGELAGLLEARDVTIPAQLDGLNTLAFSLAQRVNTLHQTGYGLNNANGLDFFAPFVSTNYALEIQLDAAVLGDPASIASATAIDSPGDSAIATALAQVRSEKLMNGGTATLGDFYSSQVGVLGVEVNSSNSKAEDRALVAQSLQSLRESVSGVSLDEEAANLVASQRAFEAAARLMNTMDEMIDTIINGMGIVGR